jgi:hypothetical protein
VSALIELGAGFNPILSGRKTFTTTGRYWVLVKKKLMPEEIIDCRDPRIYRYARTKLQQRYESAAWFCCCGPK